MKNTLSEAKDMKKYIKICSIIIVLFISFSDNSYALTSGQHNDLMNHKDYKLSYEFFEEELKNLRGLLPADKYKDLSYEINKNIDLEVQYIQETHPFYDKARMYAIIFASKALQLKWLGNFIKENKNFTHDKFKEFVNNINISNVYNFVAKTMETPDEFSIINDFPIQCNYQKDFSDWNKTMASASKWLYSVSIYDPTFLSWIAGAVLNAGAFIDRQEFKCHFRANVTKATVYYFYHGLTSKFYQIESKEIGKNQFANGIDFNTHTVKSNLVAIEVATTQKINGKNVDKFTVYQIDRGNKDLVRVNTKQFVEQIMPQFKPD